MTQPLMTAGDAALWAKDVWQPFGIAWEPAPVQPGQMRVRAAGKSADRNLLIDVTIGPRTRRIVEINIAAPVHAEAAAAGAVARFIAFSLAVITDASVDDADAWLAEALRGLRRDRPSLVRRTWRTWGVVLATTQTGVLAVKIVRKA